MGVVINGKSISSKNKYVVTQELTRDVPEYTLGTVNAGETISSGVSIGVEPGSDYAYQVVFTVYLNKFRFSQDLTFDADVSNSVTDLNLFEFEDLRIRYYTTEANGYYVYETPYSNLKNGLDITYELIDGNLIMTFNFTNNVVFGDSVVRFTGISFKSMKYDGLYMYYYNTSSGTSPVYGKCTSNIDWKNSSSLDVTTQISVTQIEYVGTEPIVKSYSYLVSGDELVEYPANPTSGSNMKGYFVYGFSVPTLRAGEDPTTGANLRAKSVGLYYKTSQGELNYV